MRSLNNILIEGLSDWSDDKLGKRMDELTSEEAIKKEIIGWIENNTYFGIIKSRLKFNFDTTPITVNYYGDIKFKADITSLTNGIFQWGEVIGDFICYNCESLESLEGSPKKVGGYFRCDYCSSLKSLEGAPNKVGNDFKCYCCNSLKTLEYAPKEVGGNFDCKDCGVQFTEDDIKKVSNVKGEIYC